jgi:16S rRNA (guanine527-N7)-methyltransferase
LALPKRLEVLERLWRLPLGSAERIGRLLRLIESHPTAPTAVRDPAKGADVHVADSLTALDLPGVRELASFVDIGSGAGLPGLVLAIALPGASFDLLEASRRKCDFIEQAVAELDLENARVICDRAESWAARDGFEAYAGALVRAVGSLPVVIEYAGPLLSVGGVLVAWRGRRLPAEEEAASRAAEIVGMSSLGVKAVSGSRNRHLHCYRKLAPCPRGFPRRTGMARKRPLGVR